MKSAQFSIPEYPCTYQKHDDADIVLSSGPTGSEPVRHRKAPKVPSTTFDERMRIEEVNKVLPIYINYMRVHCPLEFIE